MARRRIALALSVAATAACALAFSGSAAAAHHRARAHTAIVGGTAAAPGTWPWLAFVVNGGMSEACTGTVIAPNIVLTAAHCVETLPDGVVANASDFEVVTASHDWTDIATRQVSTVTQVITHAVSNYPTTLPSGVTSTNITGDAALLVLATPTTARPITLANARDASLSGAGTPAEIAGWGLTNPLATTTLPPALQVAPTVVQSAALCGEYVPTFDAATQLCAQDVPADTAAACHGDSGGPLVAVTSGGTPIEIGITSGGLNNCDTSLPDYFTRVQQIDRWVQHWITALGSPATTTPPPSSPPATTPPAAALPRVGKFKGKSTQHAGHLNLTHVAAGIIRLNVKFTLHCPRGRRGPYVETASWARSKPLELNLVRGRWRFATSYVVTRWRFSIKGSFRALGAAAGTLRVTTANGRCTTGRVRWKSAALPAA